MTSYYEVLEIRPEATRDAVKASFRNLAKKYHPDHHPAHRSEWAHDRMHELLQAYEVLIDDEKRAVYDRTLSRLELRRGETYREQLRRKAHEPASCCQLIFLDLLEGRGAEGLARYERMCESVPGFALERHMKTADHLDCRFLLAEEYERQHRFAAAFEHYRALCDEDRVHGYFKRFREEILLRMQRLVVRFLEMEGGLARALEGFGGALAGELRRSERAFVYKKTAECFHRLGEERLARLTLLVALQLNPRLAGVKKIRARLGMARRALAAPPMTWGVSRVAGQIL